MAHHYGASDHSCMLSGTDLGSMAGAIHQATMHDADLDARVASLLFRDEPPDYSTVCMHDLLSFFDSEKTHPFMDLSANATEALNQPSSISIIEDSRWKSIEEYTDSFRNVPPVVLRGVLACIGVPEDKFLSCSTSGQLVDALFSELITRAFPNLDTEGATRDVEHDILKIKNFVWMYEMSGTKISAPGIAPNAIKVPGAHIVERFTAISKTVHCLGMKEIQSIAQSLRCVAVGQSRSQLANELLVNLGYQAMHQGDDLVRAQQAVQVYRVESANGLEFAKPESMY